MKRFLAVLLVGLALGSCGGGGGSKDYNFAGRWVVQSSIVDIMPLCIWTAPSGGITINQAGERLILDFDSGYHLEGTCSPHAKTFSISGTAGGTYIVMQGQAEDGRTLSGTMRASQGYCWADIVWTADLASR